MAILACLLGLAACGGNGGAKPGQSDPGQNGGNGGGDDISWREIPAEYLNLEMNAFQTAFECRGFTEEGRSFIEKNPYITIPTYHNGKEIVSLYLSKPGLEFSGLKGIKVPEGIVNFGASEDPTLELAVLPASINSVNNEAFKDCVSLKKVQMAEGIALIGGSAFENCTALTTVSIPSTVYVVEYYAFRGCTALQEITLPDALEQLGEGAFKDCTALTSIWIPGKVETISPYVFENCTALTDLTLEEGVQEMSDSFHGCTALTKVVLPNSLQYLIFNTFSGCTALETVELGTGLKPLGGTALTCAPFAGCTALKTVKFPGTTAQWNELNMQAMPAGSTVECSDGNLNF